MTQNNSKKILVIDDEQNVLDILKNELSELGLITGCTSAAQALDTLNASDDFDVIVCDISMPVMNGLEFLYIIREIGVIVPTIMVSGYNDKDTTKEAWKLGAFDLIEKPLDFNELRTLVKKAISTGKQIDDPESDASKKNRSPITLYFDESEFDKINTQANQENVSVSTFLYKIIKNRISK